MNPITHAAVAKRMAPFVAIFPEIAYALAPVYFDIGGLLIFLVLWVVAIVASLFIKPRAITIPIVLFGPLVYFAIEGAIKDYQREKQRAAYEEGFKSAYGLAKQLCEIPSTLKVNRTVSLKAPTSIRLVGQNIGLVQSNRCWNMDDTKKCSDLASRNVPACWMAGQGCDNNAVGSVEFSCGADSKVFGVVLPVVDGRWNQKTLAGFAAPYELKVSKIEDIVPLRLHRVELSLIDVSANEVISQAGFVHFSGNEGFVPGDDPDLNRSSLFCPERDQLVAKLFSATFKVDTNNGVEK